MRKWGVHLLLAATIGLLAILPMGRADGPGDAASNGSGVAADTPTADAPASSDTSPGALAASHGLTQVGAFLVFPNEAEIRARVRQLRLLKLKVGNEDWDQRETEYQINQAQATLDRMSDQYVAGADQYIQLADRFQTTSTIDANYNSMSDALNDCMHRLSDLQDAIDKQKADLDALQKRDAGYGAARMDYVDMTMDVGTEAESVAAAYNQLARDKQFTTAISAGSPAGTARVRLGPSESFLEDLEFIRQCAREAARRPPQLLPTGDDGEPRVRVVINGKATDAMIWDSGASDVLISADMADKLGLKFTDQTPTVEAVVADGRAVRVKRVVLDSIRLGIFTVLNVRCMVLPPDCKSDDLLGDSFQRHFVCRLDQQGGKLELSPADAGAMQGLLVEPLSMLRHRDDAPADDAGAADPSTKQP